MIVRIDKSFQKDVGKITDAALKHKIAVIIEDVRNAEKFFRNNSPQKAVGV
jgi:hypothetical protein